MPDNRAFPRHQVRITGKIVSPDASFTADCLVKDISEGGALVSVPSNVTLPDRVYLWQAETGTLFECQVRWRKLNLAGLHFIDLASRAKSRELIDRCVSPSRKAHPLRTYCSAAA
jgi:PilZ domain